MSIETVKLTEFSIKRTRRTSTIQALVHVKFAGGSSYQTVWVNLTDAEAKVLIRLATQIEQRVQAAPSTFLDN